jgi:hypothetical protein
MWHSLADRRFEIELAPFTENEVTLAINRFAKELGQRVIPQLIPAALTFDSAALRNRSLS